MTLATTLLLRPRTWARWIPVTSTGMTEASRDGDTACLSSNRSSTMMKHLVHHRPPFTLFPGVERLLAGHAHGPPFLVLRACRHLRHVGLEIRADIFPVAEQQVFRLL